MLSLILRKSLKDLHVCKNYLVMFPFEEDKGGEERKLHASLHTPKERDCISVLAC